MCTTRLPAFKSAFVLCSSHSFMIAQLGGCHAVMQCNEPVLLRSHAAHRHGNPPEMHRSFSSLATAASVWGAAPLWGEIKKQKRMSPGVCCIAGQAPTAGSGPRARRSGDALDSCHQSHAPSLSGMCTGCTMPSKCTAQRCSGQQVLKPSFTRQHPSHVLPTGNDQRNWLVRP